MKKLRLIVELEYDDDLMHSDDQQSIAWFKEDVLLNPCGEGTLILHSNELGDEVGVVKVLKIEAAE